MPKYVVERELRGAGKLTPEQLASIAQKSRAVLREMGTEVQWITSYVTDDKLYCVYIAHNEEAIRDHARRGGFPCNRVSAISAVIDPATAEAAGVARAAG
jgi:hypothetical protein